jgi:hypothetical protein
MAPWLRFAGHASSPCRPSPPPPPRAVDQEVRSGAAPRRRAEEVRLLAVAQPERCRSDQADGDYKSDMEFTRATGRLQERPERLRLNMSGAGRTRHAVLVGPDTVRRTRQQCHAMVPVGPASSQARGARLPPLLWPSRWLDMLWPSQWLHLHTPSWYREQSYQTAPSPHAAQVSVVLWSECGLGVMGEVALVLEELAAHRRATHELYEILREGAFFEQVLSLVCPYGA